LNADSEDHDQFRGDIQEDRDEVADEEPKQAEEMTASKAEDGKPQEQALPQHPLLGGGVPPLSMQATLQKMHEGLTKDIAAHRASVKQDIEESTDRSKDTHTEDDSTQAKDQPTQTPAEKSPADEGKMSEGTPAWITGDIEAPAGEKDMGGWTMRAYTKEQQARLNVDEEGKPIKAEETNTSAMGEQKSETSPAVHKILSSSRISEWSQKMLLHLKHAPVWLLGGASALLAMIIVLCAAHLARRRRQAALDGTYARITLGGTEPTLLQSTGSGDQV